MKYSEMVKFLNLALSRAGADSMITPREMLRDYMTVLNILMQNKKVTFEQIISRDGVISEAETVEEDVKEIKKDIEADK